MSRLKIDRKRGGPTADAGSLGPYKETGAVPVEPNVCEIAREVFVVNV
jgi:hypothetical protein